LQTRVRAWGRIDRINHGSIGFGRIDRSVGKPPHSGPPARPEGVPLTGLSEADRAPGLALERFELLRPSPEEGVPLARVARDRRVAHEHPGATS